MIPQPRLFVSQVSSSRQVAVPCIADAEYSEFINNELAVVVPNWIAQRSENLERIKQIAKDDLCARPFLGSFEARMLVFDDLVGVGEDGDTTPGVATCVVAVTSVEDYLLGGSWLDVHKSSMKCFEQFVLNVET